MGGTSLYAGVNGLQATANKSVTDAPLGVNIMSIGMVPIRPDPTVWQVQMLILHQQLSAVA